MYGDSVELKVSKATVDTNVCGWLVATFATTAAFAPSVHLDATSLGVTGWGPSFLSL